MSVRVMASVWEASKHKGSALLLMLALGDNANDEGVAWPSQKTLARKMRMSDRQVRRILDSLLESDELEIVKEATPRRPAVYRLRVDKMTTQGGHGCPPRVDIAMSTESSLNRQEEEANASSRKPDQIFEALVAALGLTMADVPRGKNARGAWNAAVRDLKLEEATVEEIAAVAATYRRIWPDASLTPSALATHFAQLRGEARANGSSKREADRYGAAREWVEREGWQTTDEEKLAYDLTMRFSVSADETKRLLAWARMIREA